MLDRDLSPLSNAQWPQPTKARTSILMLQGSGSVEMAKLEMSSARLQEGLLGCGTRTVAGAPFFLTLTYSLTDKKPPRPRSADGSRGTAWGHANVTAMCWCCWRRLVGHAVWHSWQFVSLAWYHNSLTQLSLSDCAVEDVFSPMAITSPTGQYTHRAAVTRPDKVAALPEFPYFLLHLYIHGTVKTRSRMLNLDEMSTPLNPFLDFTAVATYFEQGGVLPQAACFNETFEGRFIIAAQQHASE